MSVVRAPSADRAFVPAADPSVDSVLAKFVKEARAGGVTDKTLMDTAEFVRADHPGGFRVFYELTRDMLLPRHAYPWIDEEYEAYEMGRRHGVESFRGSTKTSTMTKMKTGYRIGLEPHKSNLFIQSDDPKAQSNAHDVANMIALNPMWKVFFPTIVPWPPSQRGSWGAKGYRVQDLSFKSAGDWSRHAHDDPTLVGAGYKASYIVGLHPTGTITIDDINDEDNTTSATENKKVNTFLTGTLFPTIEKETRFGFNQTPWTERDALALAKATGRFNFTRTPVYKVVNKDTEGAEYFEPRDEWVLLTWPEKFDIEEIEARYDESGAVQFARMYLLDLEAAKGHNLRREWLRYYDHEEIREDWPQFMGIDYASATDELRAQGLVGRRDYFVICWGRITPGGVLIVQDGDRIQPSRAEAFQRTIARAQGLPHLQNIGIEAIGKGELFVDMLYEEGPFLPIMPIRSHTKFQSKVARSKGQRFENVLAPLFQRGRIMLSSKRTEFIRHFEDEWVSWDGRENRGTDDCLDGVYMMVKSAEGWLSLPQVQPSDEFDRNPLSPRGPSTVGQDHPFNSLREPYGSGYDPFQ